MASEVAAVLVPIGFAGAVIAALCAVVAAAAIVRGAGGLSGGATGVWIPFALLSSAAGFANQWLPLLISAAALLVMLSLGAIVRALLVATAPGRAAARAARGAEGANAKPVAPVLAMAPASLTTNTGSAPALAS